MSPVKLAALAFMAALPSCSLYVQQKIDREMPGALPAAVEDFQTLIDGIRLGNRAMSGIHDKATADASAPAVKAAFAAMFAPRPNDAPSHSHKTARQNIRQLDTLAQQSEQDIQAWSANLIRLRDHHYYGSSRLKKAIPIDRITFLDADSKKSAPSR